MRKIILSMALVALIGGSEALAQGSSSVSKNSGGSTIQAPVGHRQPRPADLPNTGKNQVAPNDPLSKANAALDRKVKIICRGC